MKVAILGSRGIPNRYGGFEELAEKLAKGLADRGHEIAVYNPSDHPITGWQYPGVKLVRIFNPESTLGSFGQFIYDLGSSFHARSYKPDIILQLGYTSSSIWYWVLPRKSKIITNMDGLEWKRSKYSGVVKQFLRRAETWAAKHSHLMVADNPEIETYLHSKFNNQTIYIPYGAAIPKSFDATHLSKWNIKPGEYNMLIARMEPENHIKEILDGVSQSQSKEPMLVIGGLNTYGKSLMKRFEKDDRIRFIGSLYDKEVLNNLRQYARFYFHGHSVGGTNPSLLEAMACQCNIIAHNNAFNKNVLVGQADFFGNSADIASILDAEFDEEKWDKRKRRNKSAARDKFNWRIIIEQYEVAMQQILI